ncbi:MAG: HAD family phosphatase [Saprospiraceae bacterium]|nr:HAD family phosphatase [Saprospiraceae bacterium]
MRADIKNIIFDFGNVILPLDLKASAQAMTSLLKIPYDAYHQEMPAYFRDFEMGKITESEFIQMLRKESKQSFSDSEFLAAWNSILLQIPRSTFTFLHTLKKTYKLYLFSNTNETHIGYVQDKMGIEAFQSFEKLFEKIWYSHRIGYRKPDIAAFEFVLQNAAIRADETIFVDDGKMHIEGASRVGLHTRWHSPDQHISFTMKDFLEVE